MENLFNIFCNSMKNINNRRLVGLRYLNTDVATKSIHNRNPRNLERMRIARKPAGFHLDVPGREYWHKLSILQKQRYVIASVIHNTGKLVLTASSNEWPIRKYLYQANDKIAYESVAQVLAERCLESGIYHMMLSCDIQKSKSDKVKSFLECFEEEGMTLVEPPVYIPINPWSRSVEKKPWTVEVS